MRELHKSESRKRLGTMIGQAQDLVSSVDSARSCAEILSKVVELRSSLEAFSDLIVAAHVEDCMCGSEISGAEATSVVQTLKRFIS